MIKDLSDNSCSYSFLTEWLPITIFLEIFIPFKCSEQKLHCIRWITNSTISKAKRGFLKSIVSLAVRIILIILLQILRDHLNELIFYPRSKNRFNLTLRLREFRDLSVIVNFYVSNSVKLVRSELTVMRNSVSVYCMHFQWELYGTNFKLRAY